MGTVFLAHDPSLDRLVALKLLRDEYSDDEELRARFLREARVVARLRHPNIVIIYEIGEDAGRPFMAMEYIAGLTLKQFLQQTPTPPLDRRLELVEELCSGLAHAHAAEIIHRDIKPPNLMLDGDGVLKILDFGIARFRGSSNTTQGAMIGTFPYMSPEQAHGRELDQRSDVFAVGAVLYELIALEQAFTGDSDAVVLQKVAAASYPPLEERVPDVNPDLAAIVRRALARDPADRFEGASAMRKAVTRVRRQIAEEAAHRESAQTLPPTRHKPLTTPPTSDSERRGRLTPERGRLTPERAAELRRQQVEEYIRVADDAFSRGDLDAALHAAERAVTVDPDSRAASDTIDRIRFAIDAKAIRQLLLEGRRLLSEGRAGEAWEQARRAEEDAARLPDVEGATSLQAEAAGLSAEASASRERQRAIRVLLDRAKASLEQGRFDTALRAVYEALALDPEDPDARAFEQSAQAQIKTQREQARQRALDRIHQASSHANAGRYQEALDLIESVDDPSETVRKAAAGVRAFVLELRRKAELDRIEADARVALERGAFEQVLAAIDAIPQGELTESARGLRTTAARAIEARIEAERKRRTLDELLAVVSTMLDAGNEEGAFERLQAALALGLADDRIGLLQQRVDEQRAAAEERRQREALTRLAEMRVASARDLADRGGLLEAIALLEGHSSSHPLIQAALQEMRLARDEQERRRREEAARRAEEDARRQAELERARKLEEERQAERRRREEDERQREQARRLRQEQLDRLAAAERAVEESKLDEATQLLPRLPDKGSDDDTEIVTRYRAVKSEIERRQLRAEEERKAEAARKADEERLAAEEARRQAERVEAERVAAEQRRVEEARRQDEEARRQAAARAEAERIAAEQRRADEARRQEEEARREAAARAEAERLAAEQRKADEDRRRKEEERREAARAEAERQAAERKAAEQRKADESRRKKEEARRKKDEAARKKEGHARPWYKKPAAAAAILIAVLSAAAAVKVWLGPGPSTGDIDTPDPKTRLEEIARQAQGEYASGKIELALGTIFRGLELQPGYRPLLDLLMTIRGDGAKKAAEARAQALSAKAEKSTEFQAAENRLAEADRLTAPADTRQSLAAYEEAAGLYARAGASGLSVQELLKRAQQARADGDLKNAVMFAEQVIGKESANTQARQLLRNIRGSEERKAQQARASAVDARATDQPTFGEGEKKVKDAAALPEGQTWRQVVLLGEAAAAYQSAVDLKRAADAAEKIAADRKNDAIRENAAEKLQQAKASLKAENLDQALRQVRDSLAVLDTPEARKTETEIGAAIKAREDKEVKLARDKRRDGIRVAIDETKAMQPNQALGGLKGLRGSASEFPDLKDELEAEIRRREGQIQVVTKPDKPPPPPPGPDFTADKALIRQILDQYVAAWERMDEKALKQIEPGFSGSVSRLVYSAIEMTLSEQPSIVVEPDGRTATLTAPHVKIYTSARAGGDRKPSNGVVKWALVKDGGGWRVSRVLPP
jgi:serine/threonine-protein kinase